MSLPDAVSNVKYSGASAGVALTIPFRFLETSHIEFYDGGSLVVGGYTLSGAGDSTGTLTPDATHSGPIIIQRVVPIDQPAVYAVGGSLPVKSIETAHDRSAMQVQQIERDLSRSLIAPIGDNPGPLPNAATRTSKGAAYDSSGDPTVDELFSSALKTKLDSIEASADVTDATNVTAAGALMDSECTNLAAVKAFTGEAGATADQTNAEIRTAVEAASDSNVFTDADHTKLNAISGTNTGDEVSATESGEGVVELATTGEATTGTDTTRATTPAGVKAAIDALVGGAPGALDTLNELAAALGDDDDYAATIATALALKATIASPTFTGTVAIPNVANLETAVVANTAKLTNVSTNLSATANGTSLTVESSDGNNVALPAATTSAWGVMSDDQATKLDAIPVVVQRGSTDVISADNLRTAYTTAAALTPGGNALSATNRAMVLIPAGRYDFGTGDGSNHGLELDAQFVDLVGLTGKREDVVLTSAIAIASRGTVEQTADDVKISFLTMEITSASSTGAQGTEAAAYFPTTALANAVLSDVICQSENSGVYSMRIGVEYAGTYTRVTGGQQSFAGSGDASGTFTDCVGGFYSFGYFYFSVGAASGTFLRCEGGSYSFGGDGSPASGTFIDCSITGYGDGFGHGNTSVSGTFLRCTAGRLAGYAHITATASFTDCNSTTGSTAAFGSGSVDADAVFIRCLGAGTHMNVGTTRDCLDTSNNRIDNTPPDAITATNAGVAASILTPTTEVTTNDDNDLDNVTLANGTSGQIKHIYCVASFAGDTWKVTPATMLGGTQITFGDNSVGTGCTLVYADNEGWIVIGNNGGTIA